MYEDLRDYEGCLVAVKKNGWALRYMPEEHRTVEVCLEAIKCFHVGLEITMESVPKKFLTSEFYLEAIKRNGHVLGSVPEEMKSPEMCLVASVQERFCFKDVPREFFIYRSIYRSCASELKYEFLGSMNWKKYVKILTEEELLEKYSCEELLTSGNAYLRRLGLCM